LVLSNKLYISAIGAASVTVSGAPSIRRRLFETSPSFQALQRKDIGIHGPYHAPKLYNFSDVDRIITSDISEQIKAYDVVHQLVGLSSENEQTSALQLFRNSVMDILARQVRLDLSMKTCVSRIRSTSSDDVRILAMGPTPLANTLISALKIGSSLNLSLEDDISWLSRNKIPKFASGNMQNSKIAIIGMAGRFPNAADHEAFWKLLEQGLDVHREV